MPRSPMTPHARPERERARARLAALTKTREPGDPAITDARRDLAAARVKGLLQAALAEVDDLMTSERHTGQAEAAQ